MQSKISGLNHLSDPAKAHHCLFSLFEVFKSCLFLRHHVTKFSIRFCLLPSPYTSHNSGIIRELLHVACLRVVLEVWGVQCEKERGKYSIYFTSKCIYFTDVDECGFPSSPCGSNSICSNVMGGYSCSCLDGFRVENANQNVSSSNPCKGKILNVGLKFFYNNKNRMFSIFMKTWISVEGSTLCDLLTWNTAQCSVKTFFFLKILIPQWGNLVSTFNPSVKWNTHKHTH